MPAGGLCPGLPARLAAALICAGVLLNVGPAHAFLPAGHELIEAITYRRLLARASVLGPGVPGRALLAALITSGDLRPPRCFNPARPRGPCGPEERRQTPLAYWPRLGSGAADLLIDRQLSEGGQCQHFMAETADGLSTMDAQLGVPLALATTAYLRCVAILGQAYDGILRDPRLAAWRVTGMYALIHAVTDSFSAAHAARDERGRIVHLLSWTLIDWPRYLIRGVTDFPATTHHAVHDHRDADYLRAGGRTEDGRPCHELHNPYAVPETCLTERALAAVAAVEDLLVMTYELRARAAREGRTATLHATDAAAGWRAFVREHLASAVTDVVPASTKREPRRRPDVFVGALGSREPGGFGVGLWGGALLYGPATPFAFGLFGGVRWGHGDAGDQLLGQASLSLFLPLVRRFAIGLAPAGVAVVCGTDLARCELDLRATLVELIVPVGPAWIGVQGPSWSWTDRRFAGSHLTLALGWAHERGPGRNPHAGRPPPAWDPPRPDEVSAFRHSRDTAVAYLAASVASTDHDQWVGVGVELRRDRPVDAVASVLADPRTYDGIVVGSRKVRWFDARWPEEGTEFHHTVGFGPVTIRDKTTVVRDALPDEIELAAGTRPLGVLQVVFRLAAEGAGTLVEMEEGPLSGPLKLAWNPALSQLTARRNDVALQRLDDLARARATVRAQAATWTGTAPAPAS